jgi:hypothetical protein
MGDLPDDPTYSAVRSVLRILGEKGLVEHSEDGARYVYRPATPIEVAREDVLAKVIDTYFAGSTEQAVTALLRMSDADISSRAISLSFRAGIVIAPADSTSAVTSVLTAMSRSVPEIRIPLSVVCRRMFARTGSVVLVGTAGATAASPS